MNIRNWFFALVVLCAGAAGCGKKEFAAVKVNAIVPHPASVEIMDNGAFLLDRSAAVVYEGEEAENSAAFLQEYLQKHYGLSLRTWGRRKILLKVAQDTSAVEGAYSLEVLPDKIKITGKAVFDNSEICLVKNISLTDFDTVAACRGYCRDDACTFCED